MQYATILNSLAIILPIFFSFSTTVFKGRGRFLIAIAAYFVIKKWAVAAAEDKAGGGIANTDPGQYSNPNALATQYKQAMNPIGIDWLMETDGTDEETLFKLAAISRGAIYKKVYESYKTQFKRDLTKDLIAELSPSDYQKFINILNA